jgi:hypothetical protein
MTRSMLAEFVRTPLRGFHIKDFLPLISTATFKGNYRLGDNVERLDLLGLDYDVRHPNAGEVWKRVALALGGVEVFFYTTFSSEPDALKSRGLIAYARPATREEHDLCWSLVARRLESIDIHVDKSCRDAGRAFYVPAVPPNGVFECGHIEGAAWPVDLCVSVERERVALDQAEREREAHERRRAAPTSRSKLDVMERARRYVETMDPAISGAHGHDATFEVAVAIVRGFAIDPDDGLDLMREYNKRCKPRWRDSDLRRKLDQAATRSRRPLGYLLIGGRR